MRIASSAGLESSAVLRGLRDRGRKGGDPRLAYVEYGARVRPCADEKCLHDIGTPGCALDDRELWWEANCALWCGRIEEGAIEDQRRAMAKIPNEFMREFFSWWEDPLSLGGAIKPESWADLRVSVPQPDVVPAIGLGGSPDGLYGAIGAASMLDDGRVIVAPADRRRGQRWLVEEAARIQRERDCAVVVASKGPLKYLIPDLVDAGVRLTEREAADWVDACEALWQSIEDGTLAHTGDKQLTDSALSAAWKKTGDRRAFARDSMSPLIEAVTLAAHAVSNPSRSAYEDHDPMFV